MRNRFTEMREMDLQVESTYLSYLLNEKLTNYLFYHNKLPDSMDCIKKNVETLFSKADTMDPEELDANFKTIMKEGEKSVEQSGKVIFS